MLLIPEGSSVQNMTRVRHTTVLYPGLHKAEPDVDYFTCSSQVFSSRAVLYFTVNPLRCLYFQRIARRIIIPLQELHEKIDSIL